MIVMTPMSTTISIDDELHRKVKAGGRPDRPHDR
jgi:hypothetical protein